MILFQPPPQFGLLNASPFCMKLEAFLRYHKVPFEIKHARPDRGPYRKIPFVKFKDEIIGDSSAIINRITAEFQIPDPLTDTQKASSHAFKIMAEEHLYWAMVYSRWIEPDIWPQVKEAFFAPVPKLMRNFVANKIQKNVMKALEAQGIGRLPKAEIYARARLDLIAFSNWFAENPYIAGEDFSVYDFSIWAVLSGIISASLQTPLSKIAKEYPNLEQYLDRVNSRLDF